MAGNEVLISSLSERFVSLERGLLAAASFFIRALRKDKVGLEIFLVSEKDMFVMNREYRGKNFPTNVLAFEEPKNFPSRKKGIKTLGEIYLAPTYIKEHGEDIEYMLLHGILHLIGFNHENKSDRISMEKIEGALMKKWLSNKS